MRSSQLLRASHDDEAITRGGASGARARRPAGPPARSRSGARRSARGRPGHARAPQAAGDPAEAAPSADVPRRDRGRCAPRAGPPRAAPAARDRDRSRPAPGPRGRRSRRHARATATPRRRWCGSRSGTRTADGAEWRAPVRAHRPASSQSAALHGTRSIATSTAALDAQLAALSPSPDSAIRAAAPRSRAMRARNADHRFRAIAIWGLGRLTDAPAAPELIKALDGRQADVVAAACLGLGRHPATGGRCSRCSRSPPIRRRPTEMRRAAIIGLGHAAARSAAARDVDSAGADRAPRLRRSASSPRRPPWRWPGRAIRAACSRSSSRALLPRRFALADAARSARSARRLGRPARRRRTRPASSPDRSSTSTRCWRCRRPPTGGPTPLWRAHTRELQDLLADALARGGDARHEALAALDSRPDGPALGALTPDTDAPLGAGRAAATREIVQPLADKLAALLDDAGRRVARDSACACSPSWATTA